MGHTQISLLGVLSYIYTAITTLCLHKLMLTYRVASGNPTFLVPNFVVPGAKQALLSYSESAKNSMTLSDTQAHNHLANVNMRVLNLRDVKGFVLRPLYCYYDNEAVPSKTFSQRKAHRLFCMIRMHPNTFTVDRRLAFSFFTSRVRRYWVSFAVLGYFVVVLAAMVYVNINTCSTY